MRTRLTEAGGSEESMLCTRAGEGLTLLQHTASCASSASAGSATGAGGGDPSSSSSKPVLPKQEMVPFGRSKIEYMPTVDA